MSSDRSTTMAERIERTTVRFGVEERGREQVARAFHLAMAPRLAALNDDHDPRFLHPGRCVVILLDDLKVTDPVSLASAALIETEYPDLRVRSEDIEKGLGATVAGLVGAVPNPAAETLAEDLLLANLDVRRLALVERLDQLRHAHLWQDSKRRRRAHGEAVSIYLPVAERTDEVLGRRYRWWCRMFEKRYLGSA